MKKILLILGITWSVVSSCSKDGGPEEPPAFFYFDAKYGSEQAVGYGRNQYNGYLSRTIYEGPKYRSSEQFDQMVLYVWPEYSGPFFLLTLWPATEPIIFSKSGTDILGEYTIRNPATTHFKITPRFSSSTFFHIVPGSEKLTITKTGDSNEGKFAEGAMIFNARIESDTIPVPVTATFRLKED